MNVEDIHGRTEGLYGSRQYREHSVVEVRTISSQARHDDGE